MGVMNCPWRDMNAQSTMTKIEKYQIWKRVFENMNSQRTEQPNCKAVEVEDVEERALDSSSFETKSDEV
jgi:hypothetical protein